MRLLYRFGLYLLLAAIVVAIGSATTFLLSLGSNFNVQHLSILNSIYYTVDTLTTNSYGDILPVSAAARAFTIITELIGVSIFIGALTILTNEIMENRLNKLTGGISELESRALRNHTILIGINTINMYLAGRLKVMKKKFVIITNSREHLDELRDIGYPVHVANLASKDSLKRYAIDRADKVVIDMLDKAQSMYAYMIVKDLAGKKTQIKIIARDQDTEKYFAQVAKGANEELINPEYDVAMEIIGGK
jgi:voltage-gated potassium channel